ncbi:MAG TPA: hypothetical protein VMZ50_13720 [Phycisphaerae bacterium]|nr:hypothetical protein [Phycisphaerae bacterium]
MSDKLPPVRPITRGPKFHWFGYYDKWQFDPAGRYVLGMEVGFEHRSPRPEDAIAVGMVNLRDGDRWIKLGESRAWCWQQGCMLQWLPGSRSQVIWNDRQRDRFVSHVLDVETGDRRTVPHAVYTVAPDGRTAVAPDFGRINDMRPGYGYAGIDDPHRDVLAPDGAGIRRVDLETGESELIVSIADVVRIPNPREDYGEAKHYFNHLLFNTDGSRFVFLHRWRVDAQFRTRMMTAAPDGSDLRVVDDSGHTSHFIWRDPRHILAWSRHRSHELAFYLYTDGSRDVEVVGKGVMTRDGHCSCLPGSEWILNDSYPGAERRQQLYLYHVSTGRKVVLGQFDSPEQYTGEWRCDLHPRYSRDGRHVTVDSAHGVEGRQLYLIDISEIVGTHE